jgi:hypothetical protein
VIGPTGAAVEALSPAELPEVSMIASVAGEIDLR